MRIEVLVDALWDAEPERLCWIDSFGCGESFIPA